MSTPVEVQNNPKPPAQGAQLPDRSASSPAPASGAAPYQLACFVYVGLYL